jgi:hypothetical protein
MDLNHVTCPTVSPFPTDLEEWEQRRYTLVGPEGTVFNVMDMWVLEPTPDRGDVYVWTRFVDDEDMDLLGAWYVGDYLNPNVPTEGPLWDEFIFED